MSDSSTQATAKGKRKESAGEILRTVVYALLIALAFRTILFQPFSIPSGSMKSTLLIGDYLFVSKYSYGYSRFSLPYGYLLPEGILGDRLFGSEPERGDVIVFKKPSDDETDYIKRLIGLPGDKIQIRNAVPFVNGEPVSLTEIAPFEEPRDRRRSQLCVAPYSDAESCGKRRFIETLPGGGASYTVLDADGVGRHDNTPVFTVPEGEYFFLGDNRDNSQDSRFRDLGFVPRENLIGRAEMVLLSSEGSFLEIWKWRGDRFFTWIE